MADTKTGSTTIPVKDTQEASVPSADQENQDQVVAGQQPDTTQPSELPEDTKERTKREFDKLRDQLKTERQKREYYEQVFESLQTSPETTEEIPLAYDPETGLVDEKILTDTQKAANEARERAERAEVAIQQYMNHIENREVHKVYPELDPENSSHNKEFYQETRKIMLDSMLNPQDYSNKQLSFMEAATQAKERLGKLGGNVEKAKAEGAEEAMANLTLKEQASFEATGSSQRAEKELSQSEEEELRRRIRHGDEDALAQVLAQRRIKSSG